jgi:hypothetical protein
LEEITLNKEEKLKKFCSNCKKLMEENEDGSNPSHGVCDECFETFYIPQFLAIGRDPDEIRKGLSCWKKKE